MALSLCIALEQVAVQSAWVDSGGLLRVGPQSAGFGTRPACYGLGGTNPTVTDAAVILGYIDSPAHFLGGRMNLNQKAAHDAIAKLGKALGQSVDKTAFAIMAVANENMIEAIKELTINEGINPAESTLVAGGGAGGLGIVPIANELGCKNSCSQNSRGTKRFGDAIF